MPCRCGRASRRGLCHAGRMNRRAGTLALAAIGETIVIIAGGLDLSAGAVVSLVNVVLVTQLGTNELGVVPYTLVAVVIALGLGGAVGAVSAGSASRRP